MEESNKDVTVRNPLQYVGESFEGMAGTAHALSWAMVVTMVVGCYTANLATGFEGTQPDNIGTEQAANVATIHDQALSNLKNQSYELNKMQVEHDYDKLSKQGIAEYQDIKANFTNNTLKALFNLYTIGATNENGAAMSEADFSQYYEKIIEVAGDDVDFKSVNYITGDVKPAFLDECLADAAILTNNSLLTQSNTVGEINSCMADTAESEENDLLVEILSLLILSPFVTIGLAKATTPLSRLPKRITLKKNQNKW